MKTPETACASCETLLPAYLRGELDEVRVEGVRAHLAGCAACRELADTLGLLHEAMKDAPAPKQLDEPRRERIRAAAQIPAARRPVVLAPKPGTDWFAFLARAAVLILIPLALITVLLRSNGGFRMARIMEGDNVRFDDRIQTAKHESEERQSGAASVDYTVATLSESDLNLVSPGDASKEADTRTTEDSRHGWAKEALKSKPAAAADTGKVKRNLQYLFSDADGDGAASVDDFQRADAGVAGNEKLGRPVHAARDYSGYVNGTDGKAAGLTKNGSGTLVLSGDNTYAGGTVVSGGTLGLESSTRGGRGETATPDVGGITAPGEPAKPGPNNYWDLHGRRRENVPASGRPQEELAKKLEDGRDRDVLALTKPGSGVQVLNGSSTYFGTTVINNGTLVAAKTAESPAVPGDIPVVGAFYRNKASGERELQNDEKVPLKLDLPKPVLVGTPVSINLANNAPPPPAAEPVPLPKLADATRRTAELESLREVMDKEKSALDYKEDKKAPMVSGTLSGSGALAKDRLVNDARMTGLKGLAADQKPASPVMPRGMSGRNVGFGGGFGSGGAAGEGDKISATIDELKPVVVNGRLGDAADKETMAGEKLTKDLYKQAAGGDAGRPSSAAFSLTSANAIVVTGEADGPRPQSKREPAGFNPYVDSSANAFSTFSIDVDTASFSQARRALGEGHLPDPEAIRTEEIVNALDYDYAPPTRDAFSISAEYAPSPFRSPLQLLKIGVQGKLIGRNLKRPAVITLAVDCSGSMDTPDRLGRIRRALRMLADHLGPQDSIAIVTFSDKARLVLDRTTGANKERILAAIDTLAAGGSTQLEGGLRLAYSVAARGFQSGGANRVVLLSDGVANLGAGTAGEILKSMADLRRQGVYLTVLGFGSGAYDDTMLEQLANKGDGNYAYVDSDDEARRLLVDQWEQTLHVIAADVKIQVEFNPDRVTRWRQIGYENRKLKKEDFRNDTVDAGEVGSGQAVTALYDIELGGEAGKPLGTIRVRYKDPDTGRVTEIERPITAADRHADFNSAPVRYRIAACAAEFAELLRVSPYAGDTTPGEIANLLRPAALQLPLDQRVQELLRMVGQAESGR